MIEVLTTLMAVAAILGVFVSVIALVIQARLQNKATGMTMLRDLQKEFDNDLRGARFVVASALIERKAGTPLPEKAYLLLDFFDILAVYGRETIINDAMIWDIFYYWFAHYWDFLGESLTQEVPSYGASFYDDSRSLYNRLTKYGKKHRNLDEQVFFSEENRRRFLEDEITEYQEAQTRSA
jgi:hypothetical protein